MQSLPICSRSGVDDDQVPRYLMEKEFRMIRVTVEVVSDAAHSMVTVRAESILRAVEIAKEHNPSCDARVAFPIDPQAFFVSNPAAVAVGVYEERAA
jgi:hypothetical protein